VADKYLIGSNKGSFSSFMWRKCEKVRRAKKRTEDGERTENKHVIGGISDFMLLLSPCTGNCSRILNKGD